MEKPPQNYGV